VSREEQSHRFKLKSGNTREGEVRSLGYQV